MSTDRPIRLFAFICLVLALGTTALYWPITHHPFIIFDDEQYVTGNTHVTTGLGWENLVWALKNTESANWHPLTWVSHQLDCTLFGLNAGGHHLVNLLFHVANTLLLFVLLRNATGAVWRSAVVAALFAWHPLHVESVAWASERKDVLSTFFWLLTLLAYVRFAQGRSPAKNSEPGRGMSGPDHDARLTSCDYAPVLFYSLALIFFALGLMSKPMVVTLPFVLLLLDFWPLQRLTVFNFRSFAVPWRLLVEKIPFFILAAAGSATTYLTQSGAGAVAQISRSERLGNAVLAYARYTAKIFWPTDLAIIYPHPRHWPLALALGALLVLVIWTLLLLQSWHRRPFLAFGWLWFLGTLVPTIGLVQVGAQSMADRYTYIPSIGFFIALVWGVTDFVLAHPRWKNLFLIITGGALVGCLLATSIQINYWRDSITLFRHAVEVLPDNYAAENGLGKAYENVGDNAHALVLYSAAVQLEPRYPGSQFNLAMCLLTYGQTAEALKHLKIAIELEPHDPDYQFNLGEYYAQNGSWTNALEYFSNSVALRPESAVAQFSLGCAFANTGQPAAAVPHLREALRLKPDFAVAKKKMDGLLSAHAELK